MTKTRKERIIDHLAALAGSKAALAKRLGVAPQDINNWRVRGIPLAKCAIVSSLFGVPLAELRDEFEVLRPLVTNVPDAAA